MVTICSVFNNGYQKLSRNKKNELSGQSRSSDNVKRQKKSSLDVSLLNSVTSDICFCQGT